MNISAQQRTKYAPRLFPTRNDYGALDALGFDAIDYVDAIDRATSEIRNSFSRMRKTRGAL